MNLISVSQYAQQHGVHRSRVHALIQDGRISAQKVGSSYVVDSATPWPEPIKPGRKGPVKTDRTTEIKKKLERARRKRNEKP